MRLNRRPCLLVRGAPAADGRAVFVDRDGVVNQLAWDRASGTYESPYRPEDVALVADAPQALLSLAAAGFRLVVISNQPAAAKGSVTVAELRAVHERVASLLDAEGVEVDAYAYCLHHPDGADPALSGPCACRKPEPGLIHEAALALGIEVERSWVVGDAETDVAAAQAAGCASILVENPRSAHRRTGHVVPTARVRSLAAGAALILDRDRK